MRQDANLGQPAEMLRMATENGGRASATIPAGWHRGGRRTSSWSTFPVLMSVPLLPEHTEQLYPPRLRRQRQLRGHTTIVDGQVVMAGRRLTTDSDEELVYRKANEAFAAVLGRMVAPDRHDVHNCRRAGRCRDAHSHILSLSADRAFTAAYGREGSLCIYRSRGLLPAHRVPTDAEWEEVGFHHDGFPVIGPADSIRDHPGFDRIVVLAVSPQFLDGQLIGTVDTDGVTDVAGPPHPEKCNDYIAAVVRSAPERFIGFGSVNPRYRGVRYAVDELERSVLELGLTGVKLYPCTSTGRPTTGSSASPYSKRQPSWAYR